jgi:hypothetical protein
VQSALAAVGAAMVVKGFRVGVAGKYAADRLAAPQRGIVAQQTGLPLESGTDDTFLLDAGMARNLLGGIAAVAIQNIGTEVSHNGRPTESPLQGSVGWSMARIAGPFDLGVTGQVTARTGWVAPGAGAELGYSWIDGFSAALRVGARRTDTEAEKPVAIGAAFTGDRLTLEYALQSFDGGTHAHRMTVRWR